MDNNTIPLHELIVELRNKTKPFPLDMYLLLVIKADTVAALNYYDGARELAKYLGPIDSPSTITSRYSKLLTNWDTIEIAQILYPSPITNTNVRTVIHALLSLYFRELI